MADVSAVLGEYFHENRAFLSTGPDAQPVPEGGAYEYVALPEGLAWPLAAVLEESCTWIEVDEHGLFRTADGELYNSGPDLTNFVLASSSGTFVTSKYIHDYPTAALASRGDGVAAFGVWEVENGRITSVTPYSKLFEHAQYDPKFVAQLCNQLTKHGVDPSIVLELDVSGKPQGRLWWDGAEAPAVDDLIDGGLSAAEDIFAGFGDDFWVQVTEVTSIPDGVSVTLTLNPVKGEPGPVEDEPGIVTILVQRNNNGGTAQCTSVNLGHESERVADILDAMTDRLVPWFAANGISWRGDELEPIGTAAESVDPPAGEPGHDVPAAESGVPGLPSPDTVRRSEFNAAAQGTLEVGPPVRSDFHPPAGPPDGRPTRSSGGHPRRPVSPSTDDAARADPFTGRVSLLDVVPGPADPPTSPSEREELVRARLSARLGPLLPSGGNNPGFGQAADLLLRLHSSVTAAPSAIDAKIDTVAGVPILRLTVTVPKDQARHRGEITDLLGSHAHGFDMDARGTRLVVRCQLWLTPPAVPDATIIDDVGADDMAREIVEAWNGGRSPVFTGVDERGKQHSFRPEHVRRVRLIGNDGRRAGISFGTLERTEFAQRWMTMPIQQHRTMFTPVRHVDTWDGRRQVRADPVPAPWPSDSMLIDAHHDEQGFWIQIEDRFGRVRDIAVDGRTFGLLASADPDVRAATTVNVWSCEAAADSDGDDAVTANHDSVTALSASDAEAMVGALRAAGVDGDVCVSSRTLYLTLTRYADSDVPVGAGIGADVEFGPDGAIVASPWTVYTTPVSGRGRPPNHPGLGDVSGPRSHDGSGRGEPPGRRWSANGGRAAAVAATVRHPAVRSMTEVGAAVDAGATVVEVPVSVTASGEVVADFADGAMDVAAVTEFWAERGVTLHVLLATAGLRSDREVAATVSACLSALADLEVSYGVSSSDPRVWDHVPEDVDVVARLTPEAVAARKPDVFDRALRAGAREIVLEPGVPIDGSVVMRAEGIPVTAVTDDVDAIHRAMNLGVTGFETAAPQHVRSAAARIPDVRGVPKDPGGPRASEVSLDATMDLPAVIAALSQNADRFTARVVLAADGTPILEHAPGTTPVALADVARALAGRSHGPSLDVHLPEASGEDAARAAESVIAVLNQHNLRRYWVTGESGRVAKVVHRRVAVPPQGCSAIYVEPEPRAVQRRDVEKLPPHLRRAARLIWLHNVKPAKAARAMGISRAELWTLLGQANMSPAAASEESMRRRDTASPTESTDSRPIPGTTRGHGDQRPDDRGRYRPTRGPMLGDPDRFGGWHRNSGPDRELAGEVLREQVSAGDDLESITGTIVETLSDDVTDALAIEVADHVRGVLSAHGGEVALSAPTESESAEYYWQIDIRSGPVRILLLVAADGRVQLRWEGAFDSPEWRRTALIQWNRLVHLGEVELNDSPVGERRFLWELMSDGSLTATRVEAGIDGWPVTLVSESPDGSAASFTYRLDEGDDTADRIEFERNDGQRLDVVGIRQWLDELISDDIDGAAVDDAARRLVALAQASGTTHVAADARLVPAPGGMRLEVRLYAFDRVATDAAIEVLDDIGDYDLENLDVVGDTTVPRYTFRTDLASAEHGGAPVPADAQRSEAGDPTDPLAAVGPDGESSIRAQVQRTGDVLRGWEVDGDVVDTVMTIVRDALVDPMEPDSDAIAIGDDGAPMATVTSDRDDNGVHVVVTMMRGCRTKSPLTVRN